jgi:FkbM family methyltransferase
MEILTSIRRPEYVRRPSQIIRRLMFEFRSTSSAYCTVKLPWGLPFRVQPGENIGAIICRAGVHELPVCECIGRLVDAGDLAVDAGANIGQMTGIMAIRAGASGKVMAFEPHPSIFDELQFNIASWRKDRRAAPIIAQCLALSDRTGVAQLLIPSDFAQNQGVSFLTGSLDKGAEGGQFDVSVRRLDEVIGSGQKIGFLKIDVEGHELQVLRGAERLLESGSIRDILFEQQGDPPTATTKFLEDRGYSIYRIAGGFLGPIAVSIGTPFAADAHASSNYLATLDSNRAITRMTRRGWAVYSGHWPK